MYVSYTIHVYTCPGGLSLLTALGGDVSWMFRVCVRCEGVRGLGVRCEGVRCEV